MLSKQKVEEIVKQNILTSDLSDDELAEFCIIANQRYRDGDPIVSDQDYDFVFLSALTKRLPKHSFLQKPESEHKGFAEEKVKLPKRCCQPTKLTLGVKFKSGLKESLNLLKK